MRRSASSAVVRSSAGPTFRGAEVVAESQFTVGSVPRFRGDGELRYGPASMRSDLRYFTASIVVTVLGLAAGAAFGWYSRHTGEGVAGTVFIVAVLSVLEVSLSVDNAVVNASVLRHMTPIWRHRFLTWGIAIAVFGMRVVFPLLVVSIVAGIGPFAALRLAALEPREYARIMGEAHVALGAFGGAFLGMVCLRYFFDAEKDVHWIAV